MKTTTCPNCSNDAEETIDLGNADPRLDGLRECGCGATFTDRAERDGFAAAYLHPRLGINLFRAPGQQEYMSIPGADLI